MIHNEMSFLFNPTIQPTVGDPIRNNNRNNTGDIFGTIPSTKTRVFKDPVDGKNVIDYVNNIVYARDRLDVDPYISLLDYFNGSTGGGKHGPISMMLKPADFVYLTNLGVYPINRLIILRRYRDGCIVPNNLTLFKEKPIGTLIGWVKMDETNKEMFSFSFSERWVDTTDTLDKVIQKIMKEQFGLKTETFLPIPSWSQGFLFGMLNNMGLTTYNSTNVPTGDPNVLRIAKMRDIESQSLSSELKINFETSYEQKYINGVDPGSSFQDILSNIARVGTSDQKFIINADKSSVFSSFVNAVNSDAKGSTDKWVVFGKELINAFIDTISDFFSGVGNEMAESWKKVTEYVTKENEKETDKKKEQEKFITDINKFEKEGKLTKQQADDFRSGKIGKEKLVSAVGKVMDLNSASASFNSFSKIFSNVIDTLLAGSVYRYRWPLRGSIGLMSGLSTTPWHLTVGNPFSPIISMANIYVDDVDLKLSSELGFQDMPKRVDVVIQLKMGRPFGKQEIERIFNNQYGRIYTKPVTVTKTAASSANPTNDATDDVINTAISNAVTSGQDKQVPASQAKKENQQQEIDKTMGWDRSKSSTPTSIPSPFLPNNTKNRPWG